ncbi:hypothetical protein BJV82DRAFT_582584 [Fennellomyces sp. T-0311]|nr:hypothetical protein BJV82DRAFT_582584 [Fennellomyces sp. T-0311]
MAFVHNTEVILFLQDGCNYVSTTVNDWSDPLPSVIYFQRAGTHVLHVTQAATAKDDALKRFLQLYIKGECSDKSSGANEKQKILKDIIRPVYNSCRRLERFISEQKTSPSKLQKLIKRQMTIEEYQKEFDIDTNLIYSGLNQLFQLTPIAEMSQRPSLKSFEPDFSKEASGFWQRTIGSDIIGTWDKFSQSYTQLYNSVEPIVLEFLRMRLCAPDGRSINIYGFLEVTRKYGFPVEHLPTHLSTTGQSSTEEARAEITKMVIPLVTEFSSQEIQQHLLVLYGWYKGIDRKNEDAYQQRANEWATLVKESRTVTTKSEEHIQAEKVDNARRALSFFYQRFMVIWRIGSVARETFAGVSFPGKPRIRDFIRLVRPLDFANYSIVIGADRQWNPPEVYHFLSELV